MKYHHAIFDLLGTAPSPSSERLAQIEARERLCGVRFPASVCDFYAETEAETQFTENTADSLIALNKLGDPAETAQGWLRVALENQAVVAWYVRLDAGDDPPVLNNNDEWQDDLSTVEWQEASQTWTNFVFDSIAWGNFSGWAMGLQLMARDAWPADALLDRLREELKEGPQTETPFVQTRRFYDETRLLFVRRISTEGGEAAWTLEARTPEALMDLVRCIWADKTLPQMIKAAGMSPQARARSEAVLTSLRNSL